MHGSENNPMTHALRGPALVRSKVARKLYNWRAVFSGGADHIEAFERMTCGQRKAAINFQILIEKLMLPVIAWEQNYILKIGSGTTYDIKHKTRGDVSDVEFGLG